jgi:hypothetical protein
MNNNIDPRFLFQTEKKPPKSIIAGEPSPDQLFGTIQPNSLIPLVIQPKTTFINHNLNNGDVEKFDLSKDEDKPQG